MSPLSYFIKVNLLLSISALVLFMICRIFNLKILKAPALYQLQLAYALLVLSLCLPFISSRSAVYNPAVASAFSSGGVVDRMIPFVVKSIPSHSSLTSTQMKALLWTVLLSVIVGVLLFAVDFIKLVRSRSRAYLLRRYGRLSLMVMADEMIPSSFSIGCSSYVLVPASVLGDRQAFHHCVSHEIQHIRQRDTFWIFAIVLIEKALIVNPLIRLFTGQIKDLQEMACDEELIVNKKVEPRAYAQTLLAVSSMKTTPFFNLAPSILGKRKTNKLIRRINIMTSINSKSKLRISFIMFVTAVGAIFTFSQYAPAMELSEKSTHFVKYKMEIFENGKVISRPTVTTSLDDEALMMQQSDDGRSRYYKLKPRLSSDGAFVDTDMEYGTFEGAPQDDRKKVKFKPTGTGKFRTSASLDIKPTVMTFDNMKVSIENLPPQEMN